jgi:ankyrin repeat protein
MQVCQLLLSQPQHAARANAKGSQALLAAAAEGHRDVCYLLLKPPGLAHPAKVDAALLQLPQVRRRAAIMALLLRYL